MVRKHGAKRVEKPPYRVPSMTEIAKVRGTNGHSVVSTFSGCGGSCLGFEMAGFEILWASEFIPAAAEVYRLNHPGVILDTRDIRKVRPEEILEAIGKKHGEIDVLEGSPPCASFSTAGKRSRDWGKVKKYSDTKQRTDDLFFEFARILEGLQPRMFVAENVAGLVKGVAKGYFKEILARLKACGYAVEARVLDAQWLGVPQSRQRTIFIGSRVGTPQHPTPLPYRYSLADALPHVRRVSNLGPGKTPFMQSAALPSPVVTTGDTGGAGRHSVEAEAWIDGLAIGDEWDKLKPGESSEKYFSLTRAHQDRPSPAVTQTAGNTSAAGVAHPTERRKFSIAELRRVCGFPDDFQLTGSYAQQWERLGRAVPPVMMSHIAEAVRGTLDKEKKTCAAA